MGDKKGRLETILTIVCSLITIVTGWAAFADTLKHTFWWLVSHFLSFWTLGIGLVLLLLLVVLYLVITGTQKGGQAWESVKDILKRLRNIWTLIVVLIILIVINFAVIAYRYWRKPATKAISGTVFYKRCEGAQGLNPAPNVVVSLSESPNLTSEPTKTDGQFEISGIPADFEVRNLTMKSGGLFYPGIQYRSTRDYEVIPQQCPLPPDVREITASWSELPGDQCLTEDENPPASRKVFVLDTYLPAEGREAVLTVARDRPDIEILNAFVLLPSTESDPDLNLYRNAMEGLDKKEKHRWIFTILKKDFRIRVEVCLGTADSSIQLSSKNLHAYYKLQ